MKSSTNEKLVQFGVLIVAISAVVISVWQGQLTKRHNELTVRPYFNFKRSNNAENQTFEIQLANQGYGPAIIEEYYLFYKGKRYEDWMPVLTDKKIGGTMRYSIYQKGDVIAAGEKLVILKVNNFDITNDVELKIRYKSIYEEEFEISTQF